VVGNPPPKGRVPTDETFTDNSGTQVVFHLCRKRTPKTTSVPMPVIAATWSEDSCAPFLFRHQC